MMRWVSTALALLWLPIRRFFRDGGSQYAGNVAFFTLLSLFPFLIFLSTLAASLENTQAATQFIEYMLETLPPIAAGAVEPIVRELAPQKLGFFLIFSLVVIIWSSANAIEALRAGLNRVYKVSQTRSFIFRRVQGFMFVVIAAVAILIAMNLLVLAPVILSYVPLAEALREQIEPLISIGRYGAAPLILLITNIFLYRFLPNVDHGWQHVVPGAVLSLVIWLVLVQAFSIYVRNFGDYSVIYGSLGGVIVLLLFLYMSAGAFLLGAEFNVVLRERLAQNEG